jgi:hydroxymethylpyrimidine pyrophosphatase-like HAD family hydrolase
VAIRCVYTDLDGTLLGRGASLFRDAEGGFTLLPARALEACHRAGVEVVLKSGRRRAQVMEDARLLGQTAYIYEVGSGLVIDGDHTLLTGELQPVNGKTVHALIEESGAPRRLLEAYAGRLEHHAPWHLDREVSHLFRGLVDAAEANELLAREGQGHLRLVDNGAISPKESLLDLGGSPHAYHLIPATASKAAAVARHMAARGYAPEECVAVGDSREDLDVAEVVSRFFLVANAVDKDPDIRAAVTGRPNVEVTETRNGEGFYEAVVRSLAESRSA